jgi:hypothetical protein
VERAKTTTVQRRGWRERHAVEKGQVQRRGWRERRAVAREGLERKTHCREGAGEIELKGL